MGEVHHGSRNPNWRGGRSVASNGYVIVRVGVGHPLADVRGYAYEHRLVATQMLGRSLAKGEHVHHINGVKTDNRVENLEVVSRAEHGVRHRRAGKAARLPDEANPTVSCACGCGQTFLKYDDINRPRVYVSGHNPSDAPTQDAIRALLADGPLARAEIVRRLNRGARLVAAALYKAVKSGRIKRVGRATYAVSEPAASVASK